MQSFEKEEFLRAVLEDDTYRAFRKQTWREAEACFRQAHRKRPVRYWLAMAAAVAMIAVLWRVKERTQENRAAVVPIPVVDEIVVTDAVRSKPLKTDEVVRSVFDRSVIVETPELPNLNVMVVHTRPSYLTEITDAQLLSLFADRPSGIMTGPEGKEFFVLEPKN